MTIQYASDLHLEFPENKKYLETHPLQPAADILILAGDVVPFAEMEKHKDFFDYLDANWEHVYWIPGNHEYYHGDINLYRGVVDIPIREHVTLLNNSVIVYDNVRIIFSTLWSHISPQNEEILKEQLSDFRVINDRSQKLTVDRFNALHREGLGYVKAFLEGSTPAFVSLRLRSEESETPLASRIPAASVTPVAEALEATIVVTHHVPTLLHYPEKYKGDALNEGFATELYDFIEEYQPDAWIFGHHHSNMPEFKIGKTRMLTNQLGYVAYGENKGFYRDRVLEL